MPGLTTALSSEKFPASGGFAGEGVRRLMGAPTLSLLQTVIRESLQNSCDAAADGERVEALVRLRRLGAAEVDGLREVISVLPDGPSREPLETFLGSAAPVVMEICDWGTRGLGGPTRADRAPPAGARMDFVNFVRNVGAARDTEPGGGTYGYGKTALYIASNCGTIVIDTLVSGGPRRMIGCHLGEAYNHEGSRYTGRHWWGEEVEGEEFVEPILGRKADRLANALGMPDRRVSGAGTSIMILDPVLGQDTLDQALGEIEDIILWFFWPKMVDLDSGPAMEFRLALEETERAVGPPEQHPPLDLFVDAYRKIHRGGDVIDIRSAKPIKQLGRLAIRKGLRSARRHVVDPATSLFPHTSHHIALMRPVELVVRYMEGAAPANDLEEWAGVFICDSNHEVERAFADAEPPAHDDWVPDKLPRGRGKTFVNVALRELGGIAAAGGSPIRVGGQGGGGASLALAAERMGSLLPMGARPRSDRSGPAGGRGGGARARVDTPRFERLIAVGTGIEALFAVRCSNRTASGATVTAAPGLVIDGVLTGEIDAPSGLVEFAGWRSPDGNLLGSGLALDVAAGTDIDLRLAVRVPPGVVVGVAVSVEQAS